MDDPVVPSTCPNCSRPVEPRAFFCAHCGTAVRFAPPRRADAGNAASVTTPAGGSTTGIRALGVLAAIVVGPVGAGFRAFALPFWIVAIIAAVVVLVTQPPERRGLRAFAAGFLVTLGVFVALALLVLLGFFLVCAAGGFKNI